MSGSPIPAFQTFCYDDFMRIEKKILPEYFDLVAKGVKTYDFRLADFEIKAGNILVLREWDKARQGYTGRQIEKEVTYVGKTKGDTTWSQDEIDTYGYQIIAFKPSDKMKQ